MLGSLATLGYAAKKQGPGTGVRWELDAALRVNPKARIVDTRFSPVCSWSPVWSRAHLEHSYGARYRWRGDVLGNANYSRPDLPIRLVDAKQGVGWVIEQLEAGWTCILLCACAQYERCHRKVIYDLVRARLGERLPCYEAGQHVMTPDGPGVIVPDIPFEVHRMRNRYAVRHDVPHRLGYRFYFPHELVAYAPVQCSLFSA